MGNSKLANRCHIPSGETPEAWVPLNGDILRKVRGDQVSAALQTLPPPTHLSPLTAVVLYDVPGRRPVARLDQGQSARERSTGTL